MIDDKKIEAAKEEIYEDRFLLNGEEIFFNNDEKEEMFYEGDIKEAIGLGAKWAINELLKDLWHPASEEPKDKSAILLRYTGSMCKWASLDEVDADDWKQTVKELGITRWLYIDDLFPKEGGEQ